MVSGRARYRRSFRPVRFQFLDRNFCIRHRGPRARFGRPAWFQQPVSGFWRARQYRTARHYWRLNERLARARWRHARVASK